jgi:hypothetical protein
MHISKMSHHALLFTNIFWWLLRPSSEYHKRTKKICVIHIYIKLIFMRYIYIYIHTYIHKTFMIVAEATERSVKNNV